MKTHKHLFILRHAKSSWKHPQLEDFERPLNKRGERNLPSMAEYLKHNYTDIAPQYILSSGAKRALITAQGFAEVLGLPIANLNEPDALYHADRSILMRHVMRIPDAVERAMLVGHNPGLTDFANDLMCQQSDHIMNLPTCAFVVLNFDLDSWSQIQGSSAYVTGFEYPKKFNM
ncbi:SixA phosphatase family protein [Marinicella sp. W31]|uniref:SixA phosphatase family protein n=1 Tax=Marinicella sp. W31 TaxID=3023713 RepID=UPI003757BAFB